MYLPGRIRQEDVSPFISALRVPLQPSTFGCQLSEVSVIIHRDQHIRILWIVFVCR
jgi:hypothetical protein